VALRHEMPVGPFRIRHPRGVEPEIAEGTLENGLPTFAVPTEPRVELRAAHDETVPAVPVAGQRQPRGEGEILPELADAQPLARKLRLPLGTVLLAMATLPVTVVDRDEYAASLREAGRLILVLSGSCEPAARAP